MRSLSRLFALPALALALAGCPTFLSDDFHVESDAGRSADNSTADSSFSNANAQGNGDDGNAASSIMDASGPDTDARSKQVGDAGGKGVILDAGPVRATDGSDMDVEPEQIGDAQDEEAIDAGTGAVAVLDSPCSPSAALACAGNAQKVTLMCNGGRWTVNQTCPAGDNCDSTPGADQGTCAPIDPLCANLSPGALTCSDGSHVATCGPDLVSDSPTETCVNTTCISGACTGVCGPTQIQCASSGNAVQTCDSTGQWGSAVACTGATGETCQNGECQCPSGETVCSGTCVNENTDSNNCGDCDVQCSTYQGIPIYGQTCQAGSCECSNGDIACGETGMYVCATYDQCICSQGGCSEPE